ncbi:MAG: 2Fe-2S iron-sulfur cluster-binding protein [Planctomycetaceae bacterium]
MPKVTIANDKRTIEVPEGANLRKEAMKNGVELYSGPYRYLNCRGFGLCCSCRVTVTKGDENLSKRGLWEKLHMLINPFGFFARLGSDQEVRLACQTRVKGDCTVISRPELNWHGEEKFFN